MCRFFPSDKLFKLLFKYWSSIVNEEIIGQLIYAFNTIYYDQQNLLQVLKHKHTQFYTYILNHQAKFQFTVNNMEPIEFLSNGLESNDTDHADWWTIDWKVWSYTPILTQVRPHEVHKTWIVLFG